MADYQLPLLSYAQPSGSSTMTAVPTQPSLLDQLKSVFSNPKTWAMMAQSPYAGVLAALIPAVKAGVNYLGAHSVPTSGQQTWDNSSWMRGGDITNPFGQNSYDSADAVANSFDLQFDGFDQEALRLGQPGSSYPGSSSMTGGYMGNPYLSQPTTSSIDLGNGLSMPVISGPQWLGPKGLPWTQGADPSSYPYSYIPPNGSWEGVDWFHLPQGQSGGGMQAAIGDLPGGGGVLGNGGGGLHARSGAGGLLGSGRDVHFADTGGGSTLDWGRFTDLTGNYY